MDEVSLEAPVQPARGKPAPLVPADGSPAGRGAGGSGAYVHTTHSNIFPKTPRVFEGTTLEGEELERLCRRNRVLVDVTKSLLRASKEDPELEDHALRLAFCGTWYRKLTFQCGTHRLIPCPCNSVFCQQCAARRSKPLIDRILKRIDKRKRYWFLTITVRSWSTLTKEGISDLIANFAKLRETREWKKHVTGGVYSVEAVFNPQQKEGLGWHPHIHVLVETPDRLPRSWIHRLRVHWRRATGSFVLNLQPLYSRDEKGRKTRRIDRRALCELVKYATKAGDFSKSPERVVEFLRAFTSVRRVQMFGSFLGKQEEPEEPLDDEKKPEDFVGCACGQCRWKDGIQGDLFRERDTFIDPNGIRQLKLFKDDLWWRPEKPPEPESQAPPPNNLDLFFEQRELRFQI
jgi:hypothetical protein